MGRSSDAKLKEAKFLQEYLATGDATQAYLAAGYEGAPDAGGQIMLSRPSVRAWLNETADAIAATAIATTAEKTRDVLETRDGLTEWLVGVIKGDIGEDWVTDDGEAMFVKGKLKERLKAAELLAKISGYLVQKVEVKSEGVQVVLHSVDNGRKL